MNLTSLFGSQGESNSNGLPNLIVIGAMKSGTTSLHYYLSSHPEIQMSRIKDLGFFASDKKFKKGVKWYQSFFYGSQKIHGEASPYYTAFPLFPAAPKRMHAIIPRARLIYIVRDPVQRTIAHYYSRLCKHEGDKPISSELEMVEGNYLVEVSRYGMQLERYLKYFPKESILVISLEELVKNKAETFRTIFRFLGVDENFTSPLFDDRLNENQGKRKKKLALFLDRKFKAYKWGEYLPRPLVSAYQKLMLEDYEMEELSQEVRQKLVNFLKSDIRHLRQITGKDFEDWCV